MNFNDYEAFVRKCPDFDDAALGLPGEVGEVLELVKKDRRIGDARQPLDKDKFLKECGDVLFYLVRLGYKNGLTFEEIVEGNVKKLSKRHDVK